MSRKNRLVLSLAKQVTRSNDDTAQVAVDRLENDPSLSQNIATESDDSDNASIASSAQSTASVNTATSQLRDTDARLKGRLASFLARSIPNAGIAIVIGATDPMKDSELKLVSLVTDPNGHFVADIEVNYTPSVIQVKSKIDETVYAFQEIRLENERSLGVISDIDDTVKLTGVVGDKRDLMRRLLLGEIDTWEIKPMVAWFNTILTRFDATFHYVSNSPWQLYNTIQEYFHHVNLPLGSFHLKQYTGNIISSLMEPSSSRKKTSLSKILNDFPEKQFICVGDSGEHDFEAYVDLAKSFPGQVKAIYIRVVEDSLSDVDDAKIFDEMKRLIRKWASKQPKTGEPKIKIASRAEQPDLIDLSDTPSRQSTPEAKFIPLVPKKPSHLKGASIQKEPPLPRRRYLEAAPTNTQTLHESMSNGRAEAPPPPPLPRRAVPRSINSLELNEDELSVLEFHNVSSYYELEDYDKTGAIWLQRLEKALESLDGMGVEVAFFQDDDKQFFEQTVQHLDSLCIKE